MSIRWTQSTKMGCKYRNKKPIHQMFCTYCHTLMRLNFKI